MKRRFALVIALFLIITSQIFPAKIYAFTPYPQTAYAREFIEKCDGQEWFIDEVERLLNVREKSLNTINSRDDFVFIEIFGLKDKGIAGVLPRAIGELYNLRELFLSGNELTG